MFGIKISASELYVELGELHEEVLEMLANNKLDYRVPFDKQAANHTKETLIHILDGNTEISIQNDIVVYIRSSNKEENTIMMVNSNKQVTAGVLSDLKNAICKHLGVSMSSVFIEKINLKNLDTVLSTRSPHDGKSVRVYIESDMTGAVYIRSMQYAGSDIQ